jgi:hypothetical protein
MRRPGLPIVLRRLAPICLCLLLASCGGSLAQAPGWTLGPALSGNPAAAPGSANASSSPAAATPSASPLPSASGSAASPDASSAAAKPFSGRMTPQVLLVGGYVTMFMDLENTGSEPLTFLNTLYDIEPTRLYSPTVAFPWASGDTAVVTRAGRFFPSPAIVQPGQRAVYVMGGMLAKGSGVLATPVANIKFCPTRGMDDVPSVPVGVKDLTWSSAAGVTTVHGTLVESAGSRRVDPPVIGVAFFDKAGAFVGAVVDSRNGDRLAPGASRSFTMEGRGVDATRIFRAEGYAFVS